MTDYIIPVTGVPGTGKSEISKILSLELGCKHVELSSYLISLGYTTSDPSGRQTLVIDEEGARRAVGSLAEDRSRCIVVSSHLAYLLIDEVDRFIPFIVLLRCNPLELSRRLSSRPWPKGKVIENVLAEAFNVIAEELSGVEHSVIEVDTTGKTSTESVNSLWGKLEGWDTGIYIDWMADPEVQRLVSGLVMDRDFNEYRLGV